MLYRPPTYRRGCRHHRHSLLSAPSWLSRATGDPLALVIYNHAFTPPVPSASASISGPLPLYSLSPTFILLLDIFFAPQHPSRLLQVAVACED